MSDIFYVIFKFLSLSNFYFPTFTIVLFGTLVFYRDRQLGL